MTLEQAKRERDKYSYLIGEPMTPGSKYKVLDVIVTPDDHFEKFISAYMDFSEKLSNDDLIAGFESKEYSVTLTSFVQSDVQNVMHSNLTDYLQRMNQH